MSLVAEVRKSSAAVVGRASSVRIREEELARYAFVAKEGGRQPTVDPTQTDVGSDDVRVGFVVMRDATNFGSGYHPFVAKLPGYSGARTLGAHLAAFVRERGAVDGRWLRSATAEDCAGIFRQRLEGPVGELMALFASAWNELGAHLESHFGGDPSALVEEARHSAVSLVELLVAMPFFQDRARYDGLDVHFYKRAQLMAFDLGEALGGDGLGRFDDLHELTLFADNLVPHVLRVDGILDYDQALLDRIERGELIPPGSPEEVEIRASAVHAVAQLRDLCAAQGLEVRDLELGDWLWNRGQQPRYKARPRHRTRSVFY